MRKEREKARMLAVALHSAKIPITYNFCTFAPTLLGVFVISNIYMKRRDARRISALNGIMLIALFSFSAYHIAGYPLFKYLSFSPMIIGILLGMLYANTLRNRLPAAWVPGIIFCSKKLLRIGIIFYGFRLTVQNVIEIGAPGIIVDIIIVASVICLGLLVGRLLKMDRDTTILCASGSAICGAAAVLGTEPVLNAKPYKTAVAVTTVVLFGTAAMFIYPSLYRSGALDALDKQQVAIYTGSTLHEVAHVVGAGNAMNDTVIANSATIVKMIRVVLLAPFLIILSLFVAKRSKDNEAAEATNKPQKRKISVPWFAIWFLAVIAINSLIPFPETVIKGVERADTFALTMAMTALGAESNFQKFKEAGAKPFIMAAILFIWLIGIGYLLARFLVPALQ